jgi:acetylglutamate kinase
MVSATDRARPDATAPVVVKLGGRALESPGADAQLADELVALRGRAVLVHGGGAELSEWCLRLGLEPRFVDGLRATDEATLEVAVAVLAGLANKRLVARLRAGGVDAEPHPDAGQLGAVGRVRAVGADLIEESLARGRTPVLASIGACDGALLNLNADDLAAAVAGALRADALVLLSDVTGLVMDGALVEELNLDELDAVLAGPQVTGGMRPKLRAARAALLLGARRVHIAAWQGPGTLAAVLADAAAGTTISHAAPARSLHA